MEPDDRLDVGTGSGDLERERATEAVSDRTDAGGVGLGAVEQHGESRKPAPADEGTIGTEGGEPLHHRLAVVDRGATTEVVERERAVPEPGETLGPALHVRVDSGSLVRDQHSRARP